MAPNGDFGDERAIAAPLRSLARTAPLLGVPHLASITFALIGLGLGVGDGRFGPLFSVVALTFALFTHELSRTLYARACGRAATIELRALGPEAIVEGEELEGGIGIALALVGSVGNALAGIALWSMRGHAGAFAPVFGQLALCHGAWGLVQLLPIRPFHASALFPRWTVARASTSTLAFALVPIAAAVFVAALPDARAVDIALTLAAMKACVGARHSAP